MGNSFDFCTLKKSPMIFLILVSFFFSKLLKAEAADSCKKTQYQVCMQEIKEIYDAGADPTSSISNAALSKCAQSLDNALSACDNGEKTTAAILANAQNLASRTTSSNVSKVTVPSAAGSAGATEAAGSYGKCSAAAKEASAHCPQIKQAPTCTLYQKSIYERCTTLAKDAGDAASKQGWLSKTGDFLTSKEFLIGAGLVTAGIVGANALGGKKNKSGGNPEPKKDEPKTEAPKGLIDKTPTTTPTMVLTEVVPKNNNGALGNPAFTPSTTPISGDTVTVAQATIPPSTMSDTSASPSANDTANNSGRVISGTGAGGSTLATSDGSQSTLEAGPTSGGSVTGGAGPSDTSRALAGSSGSNFMTNMGLEGDPNKNQNVESGSMIGVIPNGNGNAQRVRSISPKKQTKTLANDSKASSALSKKVPVRALKKEPVRDSLKRKNLVQ